MARGRERRRRDRRWFLGALGASAGAAGLAALGCGGGGEAQPAPDGDGDGGGEPDAAGSFPTHASTPAPWPERPPRAGRHGGTLRYAAALASDGRFDPHRSVSATLLGQQALVYSRLLTYESQVDGRLAPDLALGMPEQPDELTYVFSLNPAARWHGGAPLDGRPVTAGDALFSIERQRQGPGVYPRGGRWAPIASVEAPDDLTLTAATAEPFAGTLARFASTEGFVLAPETVREDAFAPQRQPGSGPFRWVEWVEGRFASVARNDAWHGPDDGPFLDGVSIVQPRPTDELEADLRTNRLDAVVAGFRQARELKRRLPALREARSAIAQFYGMRFLSALPPYDDPRLRLALTAAIDRRELLDRFFNGAGTLNPWISAAVRRWSLPQTELAERPGYRPGSGGRALDLADARAALDAWSADAGAPDGLELLVTENVERTLGMGALIRDQLAAALDVDATVTPISIETLAQRLVTGDAPWAAGFDNGWIDLDDWLYPYFHSEGAGNTFALRDDALDALIGEQRAEMAPDRRQAIGYDVQRRLLDLNVGVNLVSEDIVTLFMPYVQLFPVDAGETYQDRFADTWIDRAHPTWVEPG